MREFIEYQTIFDSDGYRRFKQAYLPCCDGLDLLKSTITLKAGKVFFGIHLEEVELIADRLRLQDDKHADMDAHAIEWERATDESCQAFMARVKSTPKSNIDHDIYLNMYA